MKCNNEVVKEEDTKPKKQSDWSPLCFHFKAYTIFPTHKVETATKLMMRHQIPL